MRLFKALLKIHLKISLVVVILFLIEVYFGFLPSTPSYNDFPIIIRLFIQLLSFTVFILNPLSFLLAELLSSVNMLTKDFENSGLFYVIFILYVVLLECIFFMHYCSTFYFEGSI